MRRRSHRTIHGGFGTSDRCTPSRGHTLNRIGRPVSQVDRAHTHGCCTGPQSRCLLECRHDPGGPRLAYIAPAQHRSSGRPSTLPHCTRSGGSAQEHTLQGYIPLPHRPNPSRTPYHVDKYIRPNPLGTLEHCIRQRRRPFVRHQPPHRMESAPHRVGMHTRENLRGNPRFGIGSGGRNSRCLRCTPGLLHTHNRWCLAYTRQGVHIALRQCILAPHHTASQLLGDRRNPVRQARTR